MSFRIRALATPEAAVLVLALLLRVWALDIKPPHFDEGINGWFADQMLKTGYYAYDPTNYHGPLHFYAVFVSQALFGRNLWALRLPAVIPSVLAVWMMLAFRPWIGRWQALVAALAMACSPAFVFYGRYSIHESWLALFLVACFWGILGLWRTGERRCLWAVVAGVAGMILTKETYIIHLASLILAAGCLWLWERAVPSQPAEPASARRWTAGDLISALALAAFAIVFFYSGAFLHWNGLAGLFHTFAAWLATGMKAGGHEKAVYEFQLLHAGGVKIAANYYWIYPLMARYEWPALAGLALCLRCLGPAPRQIRYAAIYGSGCLIAYSIIPYKTPWCIVSILWPFYFVLADFLAGTPSRFLRIVPSALVFTQSLLMCLKLNFWRFTDKDEPYVYVQTTPEIATLTRPLLDLAARDPRAYHLSGQLLLDSYYPLPWILGDFTGTGYFNNEWPGRLDGDFIVTEESKKERVEAKLKGNYFRRSFQLRDAHEKCVAYFRESAFREVISGSPEIKKGAAP